MESVFLVNNTQKTLRIIYDGASIVFQPQGQPGSLLQLPTAAADYVRGHLRDQVKTVEGSKYESFIERPKIEYYYVANMSGDPDAPEFFEEQFETKTGEIATKKYNNEMKQAVPFRARLGSFHGLKPPGTLRYRAANGELVLNDKEIQVSLPGKLLEIPAFGCVEVNREQFETLAWRDAARPKHMQGQIIRARPPQEFEPDYADLEYWTIDKMRLALEMIPGNGEKPAGKEVMGPSEAELEAKCAGMTPTQKAMFLQQARFDLWNRCWRRWRQPDLPVPSRDEFQAAWARKVRAEQKSKS